MPEPGASGARIAEKADGLTVLIRNRNRRPLLPGALRGALDALKVLDGAGFQAEILVADGASLDGSQNLIRGVQALYDEPRLRAIYLDEKSGPGALVGPGIEASSYRHVCLADADEELLPANMPLFLRAAAETGAAMVYGNVIQKKDGKVVGVRSNMPPVPGFVKTRTLDAFAIFDAVKLSNLEDAAPPDPGGPEGWNLALRLLAAGEMIVFVPAVLGFRHEYSMTTGKKYRTLGVEEKVLRRDRDGARIGRIYHPETGFLDE